MFIFSSISPSSDVDFGAIGVKEQCLKNANNRIWLKHMWKKDVHVYKLLKFCSQQ